MPHSDGNYHCRHCMIVYAPYPLGETRVQREAEALLRNGYEVDVICVRQLGELAVDSYKGVHIYREKHELPAFLINSSILGQKLFKYLRFFISAANRVSRLHFQKHYGTIQIHNLPDFLVFSAFIPKLFGAKIILDLHDLMPEFYAGHYGDRFSINARLIRLQERLACRFADYVITVSEHWRQALVKRGVTANKCSVIMNVADGQLFFPSTSNYLGAKSNGEFKLIYHGSMHQRYGIDLAIRAIDQVRSEIPGVHLMLVGRGPYMAVLKEMVNDLNLRNYVSFEPLHLVEELPDIIRSCDLGVVPYRSDVFTDGLLPTKLMEYAALGLPAIAARTTAIQAYFCDTNTEFFEPGNADDLARCIKCLFYNPDHLIELAQKSWNFNQRYNWTRISADYVAIVARFHKRNSTIMS